MNISVKGEGPQTIVFLSGAGIASPILDFKNLSDPLSKKIQGCCRGASRIWF